VGEGSTTSSPAAAAAAAGAFSRKHPSAVAGARAASELPLGAGENVNLKDLSWEDKELVLRVLFSKMNGVQSSADTAIDQGVQGRHSLPPAPGLSNNVFISEGGFLPAGEMDGFEQNYEMLLGGEAADDEV